VLAREREVSTNNLAAQSAAKVGTNFPRRIIFHSLSLLHNSLLTVLARPSREGWYPKSLEYTKIWISDYYLGNDKIGFLQEARLLRKSRSSFFPVDTIAVHFF
jgi:hypothetical protein